ncbi:MAG: hypothetical protein PF488_02935 [Patescibacteria group bacterium]|jgi:hypothetical protein|nr:hypothetical protein [Patescibacteria group bacterium]
MDNEKQIKKLETLEAQPELAIFNGIESLNGKLRAIQDVLKGIDVKEVKTYESELETLTQGLQSLTESLDDKDMVVNIPLDNLATQITKVESAIKAIGVFKETKIPEFPSEITVSDLQIEQLLSAINEIPPFPIKDLEKMVTLLGEKVEGIKIEIPENEFDYDFLSGKFDKLIKAIKGISIVVSGGGFGGVLRNTDGKQAGGTVRANNEVVLKRNTKYLIRITNDTTSDNWVNYLADWYEHTDLN